MNFSGVNADLVTVPVFKTGETPSKRRLVGSIPIRSRLEVRGRKSEVRKVDFLGLTLNADCHFWTYTQTKPVRSSFMNLLRSSSSF